MRQVRAVGLSLGLFAIAAWGCQSASAPGPGAPITAVPGAIATGVCQGYAVCGGTSNVEFQKECVARHTARYTAAFMPVVESATDSGAMVYNPDSYLACQDQLAACQGTNQLPTSCLGMLNGLVADGEPCVASLECRAGSRCVPSETGACPGECRPLADVDSACEDDSDCKRGLKCNLDDGKCVTPLAKGETCADSDECDYYLVCSVNADSGASTCETMPSLQTAGLDDECGITDSPPTSPLCQPSFSCTEVDGAGKCVGMSSANQACTPGFFDPCPADQFCNATVCVALPVAGAPCASYSLFLTHQCASGSYCHGDETRCKALGENGDACDEAQDGRDCVSGTCWGNVCTGDFVCDPAG
jgi:hypothetical protein